MFNVKTLKNSSALRALYYNIYIIYILLYKAVRIIIQTFDTIQFLNVCICKDDTLESLRLSILAFCMLILYYMRESGLRSQV